MSDVRPVSTRDRILEAARRVFGRLGYEATRVEDILVDAAVSRPTFYRVFRNKDEVYAEISDSGLPPQRSARERVLEGAREVFGQLGYEATRVEDILAASGVSRPTFYRMFSSKQEAYQELDRIAVGYLQKALVAVGAHTGDYRDLLELTVASYFEWRVGLKLPSDGAGATAEPPGIRHARAELLERPPPGVDAMLLLALICAVDALATSWQAGQNADPSLVSARRQLATELIFRALS